MVRNIESVAWSLETAAALAAKPIVRLRKYKVMISPNVTTRC